MKATLLFFLISFSNISYAFCFQCLISTCYTVNGAGMSKCYAGVYLEGDQIQRTCFLMGSSCNSMHNRSTDENRFVNADSENCEEKNADEFMRKVNFDVSKKTVADTECVTAMNEKGSSVKNCGIFPANYSVAKIGSEFSSIAFAFKASDESLIAIAKYDPDLGQAALTILKPTMANLRFSRLDFPIIGNSSPNTRNSVVKQIVDRSTVQLKDWKIQATETIDVNRFKPTALEIETHKLTSTQFRVVVESMTPEVSLLRITRFFENSKIKPLSVLLEFRPAPDDPSTLVLSTYSFQ